MIPAAILSGTQAAQRRLSFYIAVNLASVLAPGIVIVISVVLLVDSIRHPSSSFLFLAQLKNYTGPSVFVFALAVTAAGYVFGYVSRELAFKLLTQLEKITGVRAKLQENINPRLRDYFSGDLIDDCFRAHRLLGVATEGEAESIGTGILAGGGHSETTSYRDFVYAKLWIRNYAAGFSVDSIEAEINILVSGLIPTLLTAADIISFTRATWPAVIAAVVFFGLTWGVLLDSLFRLRRTERWEALRNLVMDYAMREALNNVPSIPEIVDGQQE